MDKQFLCVAGSPGTGKTMMMRKMLGQHQAEIMTPVPHLRYPGGIQIGRDRAEYSGSDALKRDIMPQVIDWLKDDKGPAFVAVEGERLSHVPFFKAVSAIGYQVTCIVLTASPLVLSARLGKRPKQVNPSWLKGRVTQARNLLNAWPGAYEISTDDPEWAERLLCSHPVARAIRGEDRDIYPALLTPEDLAA